MERVIDPKAILAQAKVQFLPESFFTLEKVRALALLALKLYCPRTDHASRLIELPAQEPSPPRRIGPHSAKNIQSGDDEIHIQHP